MKTVQTGRVQTGVGEDICVFWYSRSMELQLQFCFPDMIKLWHMILENCSI